MLTTHRRVPAERADSPARHRRRQGVFRVALYGACIAGAWASTVRAQHNTDLWVGQSGGQVAWSPGGLTPGSVYHPLDRSFLHGWSDNDPGFDHASTTEGEVSPLPGGTEIWLEVVSLDAAFFVIDGAFELLALPGDSTFLGGADLHEHITWFIDEQDAGFDAEQCVWEATFRLTDEGGGLADSDPFTLLFTNVPVRGGGFPPAPVSASGDFDGDRDVDLDDLNAFLVCVNGPQVRPAPSDPDVSTCEVDCHNAFDFDDDMDVDLMDFAEWQMKYTGSP